MTTSATRSFGETQVLKSAAARFARQHDWVQWPLLLVAIVGGGALVFHLTRTTTFWFDEWLWVTGRRGTSLATFLTPHGGHLSLVPVLIYKALFATAGLKHYGAYRLVALVGHLSCVTLVYLYVRRRVGWPLALSAAVLVMLLGSGWENILSPFQMAWTVAVSAGIGALLMLESRTRVRDLLASLLIALSLASTSIGVAIAAGVAVQIALSRRRWRDEWIVAVPVAVYGIWWLAYGETQTSGGSVFAMVQFAAESLADSFSALLGLSGATVQNPRGTLLAFGAPLALAAVLALAAARRRRAIPLGAAPALAVMLLVFSLLAGLTRSVLQPTPATRYLYVNVILLILILAELMATVDLPAATRALVVLAASVVTLSNLGVMRNAAEFLRAQGPLVKAEVGALNLSRSFATPGYVPTAFPGYPFVVVTASSVYAAERELGSPGFSASQLASIGGPAGTQADTEMANVRRLRLHPAGSTPRAPNVTQHQLELDPGSSGHLTSRAGCVVLQAGLVAPGQRIQLQLTVPASGVSIAAVRGDASVGVRRFGNKFLSLGSTRGGSVATLQIPSDGVSQPWHLQLSSMGEARACPRG